jgi:hypothetical protein
MTRRVAATPFAPGESIAPARTGKSCSYAVAVPEPLPPSLPEERRHRILPELFGAVAHGAQGLLRREYSRLLLRCSVIEIHHTFLSLSSAPAARARQSHRSLGSGRLVSDAPPSRRVSRQRMVSGVDAFDEAHT